MSGGYSMAKTFTQIVIEDRRLVILRLVNTSRGVSNDSILLRGVRQWGLDCSTDGLRTDLDFLADEGAVTLTDLDQGHVRVNITTRGREVVSGDVRIGGVTPPEHAR